MDYKVLFIPAIGDKAEFEKEYETAKEAETALVAISLYTLLLHECSYMPDYSNAGMALKKDEDGDWIEIDEDELEI